MNSYDIADSCGITTVDMHHIIVAFFILANQCLSSPSNKIDYDFFVVDGEAAFETRLEGLNFDSTVAALGRYSQYDNVAISVKRVYQRGEVIVQMVGPGGMKIKTFLPESSIMT